PDETLAIAFIYINRFYKFTRSIKAALALDLNTLTLVSLSLALKSSKLNNPSVKPLTFPFSLYNSLRATFVQAKLILLYILKFKLRLMLLLDFLSRYLNRIISEVNTGGRG
ncbi:hypothetical protein V2W45_1250700, partial [Cenococcum geophilum]